MSEVRVNNLSNENNTSGPTISGITTYSGKHFFVPPQGDTASRPSDCEPGSFGFNTDTKHLEYFRGNTIGWVEVEAELTEPLGGGTGSNAGLGHRGFFMGGINGGASDIIDQITISTLGNAQDFGNLTDQKFIGGGGASRTRAVSMGGGTPVRLNIIDFFTMSSLGNAQDFGDTTTPRAEGGGLSNSIRAIYVGGSGPSSPSGENTIDFITISSTGNAVDFGDETASSTVEKQGALASTTRGIIAGGSGMSGRISFLTIMTTGNTEDFGDLTAQTTANSGAGNATRGVISLGYGNNSINFITIATTGDAIDFGDRTLDNYSHASCSSPTRMATGGGYDGSSNTNMIDFVEIATTGNAQDFGDLSYARRSLGGTSNGHGGL